MTPLESSQPLAFSAPYRLHWDCRLGGIPRLVLSADNLMQVPPKS